MGNRKHSFATGEYYHCYNRGVDKRKIFMERADYFYFLKSLKTFNSTDSHGSLQRYEKSGNPLVQIISYNFLPNHYHLLLQEIEDDGISTLMKKLGTGYTLYFNDKYQRSGSLFQGRFKSKHIVADQDLRQITAYIDYNHLIHRINDESKYLSHINDFDFCRGSTSSKQSALEIVDIIKDKRLDFIH